MRIRIIQLITLCVIALGSTAIATPESAAIRWKQNEYLIEQVDLAQDNLTIKSSTLEESTVHVLQGADITVDGREAALKDLKSGMKLDLTLSEPGVAQRIEASEAAGEASAVPTPVLSGLESSDNQSGIVVRVIVSANSPNGCLIGNVAKGTTITFRYLGGFWKPVGMRLGKNPDDPTNANLCRLAIAPASTSGSVAAAIALVPPNTKIRPYTFQAQQDCPSLVLRINRTSFNEDPGDVAYDLQIEPPSP